MTESHKEPVSVEPGSSERESKLENMEILMEQFKKKLELYKTNMVTFAKHMQGVCEHVEELAVELNDELGNITAESEDNLMENTFNNP